MNWPESAVNYQKLEQLKDNYRNQPTLKEDEKRFLIDLYNANKHIAEGKIYEVSPREIINSPNFYTEPKRAWYILSKWSGRDIYDWGVTLDLGWLTAEGERFAKWLSEVESLSKSITNQEDI